MKNLLIMAACATLLSACGDESTSRAPTETVAARSWTETLEVEGEIKAASDTPLKVPGEGWDNRTLLEMVEDGSIVKKGDVVARFDAPRARMELTQAEAELLRKELGELTLQESDAVTRATLMADSAKVNSDLTLSERYAGIKAETGVLTRNQILDALQDTAFLKDKRGYLTWKDGQLTVRTSADNAVLASQKNSVTVDANRHRKSLAALELVAPHDGVFLLKEKWDGSKPQIGANVWAGTDFGKLPDFSALNATFSVPESAAFGLKPGQPLRARLAGTGTEFDLVVTKVGASASTKSRESPVKYSDFEAAIDPAMVGKFSLRPGQAIRATVRLIDRPTAVTVPNLALVQEGSAFAVYVGDKAPGTKQAIVLGLRGPVRSEVKSGLPLGAHILLLPTTGKESKDKKDGKDGKDQKETKQA